MIDETKEQVPAIEQEEDPVTEDLIDAELVAEGEMAEQESKEELLQQELAESREQLLRVAAEFDNFKKRMEREKDKLLKYAGETIFRELLGTLDNLDRALEQGQTEAEDDTQKLCSMLEGIELTRKILLSALERHEVAPLSSVGMLFNPDEHDALTMEPSETIPANHVAQEFAKGYRFKDRILRHAQVIVSSGPGAK